MRSQKKQIEALKNNISQIIVGKEAQIEYVITALLAGGHVLLEDVPGTGKTMLAKSLAKSIAADYGRVQFTPDLLPSDLLGLNYYNQKESAFTFKPGPVFCNILLADEINRATPRTQSSLLESMEEKQVTIDGTTRILDEPFFVIATQNPIETVGTFPLPEAQLDRFLMKLSLGLPDAEQELRIIKNQNSRALQNLKTVITKEEIVQLKEEVEHVYLHEELMKYIVSLVMATRQHSLIRAGVSTRGTLAMVNAVKAYAMVKGRNYVVPEDVKAIAVPVMAHRIVLHIGNNGTNKNEEVIRDILDHVSVPTEDWSK